MQKDIQEVQRDEQILSVMERTKANIYKQMGLTAIAIVITVVLCFAMTVAWYSNVIHTGSMTFQASDWDFEFEGRVSIGEGTEEDFLSAAPGDSELVELSITNTSSETLGVMINVVNDQLGEEMRKRIYFYVDGQQSVNGELTERTYISQQDGYTYRLLPGNNLSLSEEYCSDRALRWEWVYDVLGYYVRGTVATGDANGEPIIMVEEYLRPVVYDYDSAEFDAQGYPSRVNGLSLQEYLADLYATDGYVGSEVGAQLHGYYAVDVDESGHGVWLYLCSQEEIAAANAWDYALGSQEEKRNFQVNVLLTGQKLSQETYVAVNATQLTEQLAQGTARVQLPGDLALEKGTVLTVPQGADSILDLNGHTLTGSGDTSMIQMGEGSSLTIINGSLEWEGNGSLQDTSTRVVYMTGASLSLSGVTVTAPYEGIYADDSVGNGGNSRIHISNSTMDVGDVGVLMAGNGNVDAIKSSILIENSTIKSGYIGVMGNGSDTKAGTDICIIESEISGYWAGVFHPQDGTMKVSRSTITGYTGLVVKGGTVSVKDCQIFAAGEGQEPSYSASGFVDTGIGIYVEDNYNKPIFVTIEGDQTVVKSEHREAVLLYKADSQCAYVVATGGAYSSDVSAFLPEEGGYVCTPIADGSFSVGPTAPTGQ